MPRVWRAVRNAPAWREPSDVEVRARRRFSSYEASTESGRARFSEPLGYESLVATRSRRHPAVASSRTFRGGTGAVDLMVQVAGVDGHGLHDPRKVTQPPGGGELGRFGGQAQTPHVAARICGCQLDLRAGPVDSQPAQCIALGDDVAVGGRGDRVDGDMCGHVTRTVGEQVRLVPSQVGTHRPKARTVRPGVAVVDRDRDPGLHPAYDVSPRGVTSRPNLGPGAGRRTI